jgi:hypothetical protein
VTAVTGVARGALTPAIRTVTGIARGALASVSSIVAATRPPVTALVPRVVTAALPTVTRTATNQLRPVTSGGSVAIQTSSPSATSGFSTGAPPPGSASPAVAPQAAGLGNPVNRVPTGFRAPSPPMWPVPARAGSAAPELPIAFARSELSVLHLLALPAPSGASAGQAPVAGPSALPPATGASGIGGGAATGGFGIFFFGAAALLALALLAMSRLMWVLRTTVLLAAPTPFLSLQERPG